LAGDQSGANKIIEQTCVQCHRLEGKADHVTGVNLTPLKELLAAVQGASVYIWV
jgi:cytochrome c2